jgi:toxin ParE1/3/4
MARLEFAPEVFDDFNRFFKHLTQFETLNVGERIAEIILALQILATSPLIGRPVKEGKRELVIGRGSRGYVALYRYIAIIDTVFVLAIRNQKESGFKHDT